MNWSLPSTCKPSGAGRRTWSRAMPLAMALGVAWHVAVPAGCGHAGQTVDAEPRSAVAVSTHGGAGVRRGWPVSVAPADWSWLIEGFVTRVRPAPEPVDWSAGGVWWVDAWAEADLADWTVEEEMVAAGDAPMAVAGDADGMEARPAADWWRQGGVAVARRQLWSDLTGGQWPDTLAPAGDTALCAAVRAGDAPAVRWLLTFGADAALAGREGQPPLWLAVALGDAGILRVLLEHGAEADRTLLAPLDERFMELFAGAPFQLRDRLRNDAGLTPLMAAAALGDYAACELLLAHGARTSVHTARWKLYPINFAAHEGHVEVMQLLLGRAPGSGRDDVWIKISLAEQRAWLLRGEELLASSPVSTGREGHETPTGTFVITNKHPNWVSNIYHVRMPHFMRLSCSAIGLHAGHVPGRPASAGCIRLPPDQARLFYQQAQVGHRVVIVE